MCRHKYAPELNRFGSRSRRELRNLFRCARVFLFFSACAECNASRGTEWLLNRCISTFPSSFQQIASKDTWEIERQPMNQALRATMPQSTHRTFATVIIVIMLVTGLVLAQKYTGQQGDPDSLVFPDDERWNPSPTMKNEQQLSEEIGNLDFDELLVSVKGGLPSKMGENEERANAERPTPARCMPELQVVSLKLETDPSTIYYPSCTRIRRCGGCCSHSLLSCQPTASIFRNFEVLVVSSEDSGGFNYKNKQIVSLEEHTKCMCDCIIKAKDCNSTESYVQEECRCM